MIVTKLLIGALLYTVSGAVVVDHDEYRNITKHYLEQYGVATDNGSLLRAVEEDKRPIVRSIAADLLTNLKEPRTAPLLRARLAGESDETVRAHFARDLLALEGKGAQALARSTRDALKGLEARMWLAGALAESGDLSGYSDVLAGLNSGSARAHSLAAQHVVEFVKACRGCDLKPQPLDVALGLLEDPSAAVRISAENAVTERLDDDPRSGVALSRVAATDKDELVRKFARTSLELWWQRMKKSGSGGAQ
jgi:HEAT repeat protein